MTRYLLDTNIIGDVVKPKPSEALVTWMAERADEELFIDRSPSPKSGGVSLRSPPGKNANQLEAWFSGPEGPPALFAGRVLPFDERAGLAWARLMAEGRAAGRPRSALDMIIAAVAEVNDCILVTDNERDFAGISILNPLRTAT